LKDGFGLNADLVVPAQANRLKSLEFAKGLALEIDKLFMQ
jgi:hypothetical protein